MMAQRSVPEREQHLHLASRRRSFKAVFREARRGASPAQQRRRALEAPAAGQEGGRQLGLLGGRRRSSEIGLRTLAALSPADVGSAGARRKARRGAFEADLLGRLDRRRGEGRAGSASAAGPEAACGPAPADGDEERLHVAVAFVARRVYRRLRGGSAPPRGGAGAAGGACRPPLLGIFEERCFDGLRGWRGSRSRCGGRQGRGSWLGWCKDVCAPSKPPGAVEVSGFLLGFATWCALPPDLILVALVYMDRLLDRCELSTGVLTARSWRPLLTVCLLLASKMWEDWCVCNAEAAQFTGYACESLLCWELAALEMLGWHANISADVFAPYFWAVERSRLDGPGRREEWPGHLTAQLSLAAPAGGLGARAGGRPDALERPPLEEARGSTRGCPQAVRSAAARRRRAPAAEGVATALARRGGPLESMDQVRRRVDSMGERMRSKFVLVARLEDRYRFLESIGRGSFGEVKLAMREDNEQMYAVKVFGHAPRPWLRASDLLTESFVLNGVGASLCHPNVVSFLEYVVDESRFLEGREQFVLPVMELLRGPDLFDWLQVRQQRALQGLAPWISRSEAASIALQVASALAYIHGNAPALVHRDVKPENLRWASAAALDARADSDALSAGPLKLVDFGTVYVEGYQDALEGLLVGTPLYMAPEAFQDWEEAPRGAAPPGGRPAAPLDMFSLGVVVLLLLSGSLPGAEPRTGAPLLDEDPPLWSAVPPDAAGLVRGLLSRSPQARPTAVQVLQHPFLAGPAGAADGRPPPREQLPLPSAPLASLLARSAASSRGGTAGTPCS